MPDKEKKLPHNVLLTAMKIGRKIEGSRLRQKTTGRLRPSIEKIARHLGSNTEQALYFCAVLSLCENGHKKICADELNEYIGLPKKASGRCNETLLEMTEKKILAKYDHASETFNPVQFLEGYGTDYFRVHPRLLHDIKNNIPRDIAKREAERNKNSAFALVENFGENFFKDIRENLPSPSEIRGRIEALERKTPPNFLRGKHALQLNAEERALLYAACRAKLHRKKPDFYEILQSLRPDDIRAQKIKERELTGENSALTKQGLVSFKRKKNPAALHAKVTDKGIAAVFGNDAALLCEEAKLGKHREFTRPQDIKEKRLFFSGETKRQIEDLLKALDDGRFKKIQARLKEKKMPTGVCCLFYGDPGTGKTESAMQIARKTGRALYKVETEMLEKRRLGESERNTKSIFTKYKKLCESCAARRENVPILFLNEADALISKRVSIGDINPSIEKMENAMQEILLEQMEKFEGIMIATTNLAENFDKAFERRFLFKVKFEKPAAECRAKMWADKAEFISKADAKRLAEKYDFSGGEIDNVVRKTVMQEVVSGRPADFEEVKRLCKSERLENYNEREIGFGR